MFLFLHLACSSLFYFLNNLLEDNVDSGSLMWKKEALFKNIFNNKIYEYFLSTTSGILHSVIHEKIYEFLTN